MSAADFPPTEVEALRDALLAWFEAYGRRLAFRGTTDPYAVLVSEVMLQQTQVGRVEDAWSRFLDRFPTAESLAAAAPAEVLRAWRGMGYNRRALALQRAARAAASGGGLPHEVAELERLPGVGPYTARAVAAIAHGRPVGAVDTNVRRVLGRISGAGDGLHGRRLQALADALVPADRPGDWTHALMDVGATLCLPRAPGCSACPVRRWCRTGSLERSIAVAGRETAARPSGRSGRSQAAPFPATVRWLRGRIVDRLREAADGEWTVVVAPIGRHATAEVERALAALAREGLLERDPGDPSRARLPQAG